MARRLPTELKRDHNSAFVRWNGERIYFGRWGERATSKKFALWLAHASGDPTSVSSPDVITVVECCERYLLHAEAYYPPGEYQNVSSAVSQLMDTYGEAKAVDFGPRSLKKLQKDLARAKNDDDSLTYARTTINAMINRIRRCLRWCVSEELIPVEIVTALETVPGIPSGRGLARESTPVPPVPREVVVATLPYVSPTVAAMIQVQYLCGMRPQDVCRMTTGAIDQDGDVWIYRPVKHKGTHRGQLLMKAIPRVAQTILKPLLREGLGEPIFSPLDSKKYFGNAPKNGRRTFYSTASYGKSIVGAIAQAAKREPKVTIPHWQPNQLRHAIGTDLRNSLGIEAAQAYLGHAKPDTTLIYAKRTEDALREIARGILQPLAPTPPQQRPPE